MQCLPHSLELIWDSGLYYYVKTESGRQRSGVCVTDLNYAGKREHDKMRMRSYNR